ncbi:hypothetical protein HIM_03783 [Hirsutella minnesotensis 3608]|uniref:Uncharacterized protein n=1 Tax=Hirsutella minnesotensis 3608 TaxID=1043627 RepID=A0A0F7ZM22_9HYPO|nr:hypothetical protein HIM_03783 [Hirsutella minnesotensis 3608]
MGDASMEDTPMPDAPFDDLNLPMNGDQDMDMGYLPPRTSSTPPGFPPEAWEYTQSIWNPTSTAIINAILCDEEYLNTEWFRYGRGLRAVEPYPEPGLNIVHPRDLSLRISVENDDGDMEDIVHVSRRSLMWDTNFVSWHVRKRCFAFRGELRLLKCLLTYLHASMFRPRRIKKALIRTRSITTPLDGVNVGLGWTAFVDKVTIVECALLVADGIDLNGYQLLINGRSYLNAPDDAEETGNDRSDGAPSRDEHHDDGDISGETLVNGRVNGARTPEHDGSSPLPADEGRPHGVSPRNSRIEISSPLARVDALRGTRAPANSAVNSFPPVADGINGAQQETNTSGGRYNLRNRNRPPPAGAVVNGTGRRRH